jgi:hypothetical protein
MRDGIPALREPFKTRSSDSIPKTCSTRITRLHVASESRARSRAALARHLNRIRAVLCCRTLLIGEMDFFSRPRSGPS